ncbi:MAG: ABC transporter ATP-binding protein [Propionibacteriaceae bacterium]
MATIELNDLATVYPGGVRAVDNLDLSISDGEFFALLGPSGCGKTTLLRTIAGLEASSEGSVTIDGKDVTRAEPGKRGVAMVFQDYALFPHMTVSDNIGYPLRVRHVGRPERDRVATETAEGLSLHGLLPRRPGQLSGGQQQRVALARAVASKGSVLLLDEPLSNLDARLRLEARTFLKKFQRDLAITTVFVTHDQAEALALADRIAVMKDGKLRQVGTPKEVFQRPVDTMVANFIGSTPMNLIPGEGASGHIRTAAGTVDPPAGVVVTDSQAVIVGVRPEYLLLNPPSPAGNGFAGVVVILENLGVSTLVTVECDGVLVGVTVAEDTEPEVGARVTLTPAANRVLVYDQETELLMGE